MRNWTDIYDGCVFNCFLRKPKTLDDLTEQVMTETLKTHRTPTAPVQIDDKPTQIDDAWLEQLTNTEAAAEIWAISPYELTFDLSYIDVVPLPIIRQFCVFGNECIVKMNHHIGVGE